MPPADDDRRLLHSYVILVTHPVQIVCVLCERASTHRKDIAERYCGNCHLFHEVVMAAREQHRLGATHDCGEWQTATGQCALCDWDYRGGATGRREP